MSGSTGQYHRRTPPINGAFPLDHDGECKGEVRAYLQCLKENKTEYKLCDKLAKAYFQCRLDNELITLKDWEILGFGEARKKGDDDNVQN